MRQQSRDTTPIEAETPRDDNVNNASIQAQLQERARMAQEREQQGQAHQSLLSRSATPVLDMIFGGLSRTSSRVGMPMAQPVPQLAIDFTQDNPQAEDEVEMMTAREEREAPEPKQAVLRTISYRLNVGTMSAEALKFQLFLRGFDVDDPENELPTRAKGKGGGKTTKQYYVDVDMILFMKGFHLTLIGHVPHPTLQNLSLHSDTNSFSFSADVLRSWVTVVSSLSSLAQKGCSIRHAA